MDMVKEPFTSVVVAYFFPVKVLLAVTATPGKGTAPAFTVPLMVPPFASAAVAGAVAGAGAGVRGAVVCAGGGVWPRLVPTIARITAIHRIAACTLCCLSLRIHPILLISPIKN